MNARMFRFVAVASLGGIILLAGCSQSAKPSATARGKAATGSGRSAAKPVPPETTPPAKPAPLPVVGKEDLNGDAPPVDKTRESDKEVTSLFEEALAATQEAQAALEKDDMDKALAKLDEAYAVILKAKLPADSPLIQEKNDIRILIAQKIQQVYALRPASRPSLTNALPLAENRWVDKEIQCFQNGEKQYFLEAYKRSGLYHDMLVAEMRKAALPDQLAWVPMIESWFKPRALSRARALGMWQFVRSTGYRYGLKQDKYVDERMDPVKSTRAAIGYLTELHGMFGDWTTALAAYNCGEAYVQNIIRAQRIEYLDNFWDLFNNLPYETARYVPRLIAALRIISEPAKYGFELPTPDPTLEYETVKIGAPVKLAGLSQAMGLDPILLTALNPELRHDSTPNYDYDLRVPKGYGEKCLSCVTSQPEYVPPDIIADRYVVKPGDTLGGIARRFRTSVDSIVRINNLRSKTLIYPGQVLRIPVHGAAPDQTPAPASPAAPAGATASPQPKTDEMITYVVKTGDTLFSLSKAFKTSVEKIKADNGLTSDELTVGQKLTIQSGRS